MKDLEDLAREAAAWMKAESAETQAEVYLSAGEDRMLARREGERDGVEASETRGAGVRVAREGRVGFAAAGGADLGALKDLYRRAVEQLPHAERVAGRRLPDAPRSVPDTALAESLWDE